MNDHDVIVAGGGLAGLACAFELSTRGFRVLVLEAKPVVGGRTSSWVQDGMIVESGLHRVLGFYRYFPNLLRRAGIELDDIVMWEDEVEIRLPDGRGNAVLGAAPLYRPFGTAFGAVNLLNLLSPRDLASLPAFFAGGLAEYFSNSQQLDRSSVVDKARSYGVTDAAIERLLVPLTSGLFFLPPDQYSAYAFFGTLGPYLAQLYSTRVGAFRGGMTEVLAAPLAMAIVRNGGTVRTGTPVRRLLFARDRIVGVATPDGEITARHVVVATPLAAAQCLVRCGLAQHPWFAPMLRLPSMPALTIQLELDGPSMPVDHTTFGPGTILASFAEQSRTTFCGMPGRLSIILTPPESLLRRPDTALFAMVCDDAERLGLRVRNRVTRYRIVRLPADFYSLSPGTDQLRPPQETPLPGLTLAGDYTRQPYLATMEGAVFSGLRAADVVGHAFNGVSAGS